MFFNIGPRVRHVDLPGIGAHIRKGIQHMCQLVDREVTRIEVTAIDCLLVSVNTLSLDENSPGCAMTTDPVDKIGHRQISSSSTHPKC
jgi:hypothetical protein